MPAIVSDAGRPRSAATEGVGRAWQAVARLFSVDLGPGRFHALDGVRALSVTLVYFVHFAAIWRSRVPGDAPSARVLEALAEAGNSGVDIFFAISGILIYRNLIRSRVPYSAFLRRRVMRIYPTFLVVLAVYLGLSLAFPSESKLPATVPAALAYVAANVLLLPGLLDIPPIVTVAWSLSYEFAFYLALPLVFAAFGLPRRTSATRLGFLVVVAVVMLALNRLHVLPHPRSMYFVSGMIAFEVSEVPGLSARLPAWSWTASFAVLLGCLALVGTETLTGWPRGVVTFVVFGWFVLAALVGRGPVVRFLELPAFRWLGAISYSYYLVHGLTLKGIGYFLDTLATGHQYGEGTLWLAMAGSFVLTCLTSAALFLAVEKPASLSQR